MSHNILLITSSPRQTSSLSSKVALELVEHLKREQPGAKVTVRDLARDPPPHIGDDFAAARMLRTEPSSEQQKALALSDALIDELKAADTIVIASGMINFSLPTTLKSWFDYIIRPGKTFRYTPEGRAEGLVKGKIAYLVEARGGIYSQGALKAFDFQEPYLKLLLGFIGITEVEIIRVEGVALGPAVMEKAVTDAIAQVRVLTFKPVVATG